MCSITSILYYSFTVNLLTIGLISLITFITLITIEIAEGEIYGSR